MQEPQTKEFWGCVLDELTQTSEHEFLEIYVNSVDEWEALRLIAWQSLELNVEHSHTFIDEVFKVARINNR
ncbi:hypothetical protein F0267_17360 [Vibrio coralliilyticus]|uniref:Uncharacterized protein n=1 Tax=Vibrio coralliilyticus TaxID=190893 RepID=A0AAN0SBJ8_9VIBR|nr:hypothetical protein [Vibrio coralliilyticus]AIW18706.1 hypothetical protein IX92_06445 [Vibrio coralliilyticus]NOH39989.1 hypothetical protein [Vibrio coralliilyticus]